MTDITEEELPADDEPKEEDSPEESENEEKEAELLNESAYNEQVALLEKGQEVLRQQVAYNDSDFKDFCEEEDLDYNDPNALQKYMELYDVASLLEALDDDDQDRFWELRKSFDAETYEAVQAKVTRPVKEDETEEESEEGLSTGAKVALGVGALAAGVALFGAEEYPQEFLDEFYDFDSNPTADTQDEETLAIAYAAWKYSKENTPYEAETDYTEIYGASVNVGEKRIMSRKDYDIDNELSGFSNMEIGDVDLDDYEDEITDSVEDEITEAIRESVDDAMPISDGESISSSVNVDTEIEITVPISGDIDYDWTANETYEDERHDDEWNAEHESESDGYAYAYTKGHNDGINDEVIYRPSLATDKGRNIYKKILKQKAETFGAESHRVFYSVVNTDTGDEIDYGQMVVEAPSMKEALEKAQIMLDKNAYVGEEYEVYPNGMRVQAESFEAEKMGWDIKEYGNKEKYASKDGVEVIIAPIRKSSYQYHPRDAKWKLTYGRETPHGVVPLAKLFGTYGEVFRWLNNPPFEVKSFGADTIGNPSPSGPSSTPEPAEATGSEPSNENMESEGSNMKMALGILGVGVGAVALLGGDRIQKLFDRLGF